MEKPLVNRVASSGLITINLEEFFPKGEIVSFDLKDYLFQELILKEKDFRNALAVYDWASLKGKNMAVFCSTDAIIPVWAFMLVASLAEPFVEKLVFGNKTDFYNAMYTERLNKLDISQYSDKRIVIKGCSHKPVPVSAYVYLTKLLRPVARSIMYGEPCSTVPIYKKARD